MREEGKSELQRSLVMTEFEVISFAAKIKPEHMLEYMISI